jgi:phosphoribosylglycinamide formyltransferase 1
VPRKTKMRIVVLTSNSIRHKFVANSLIDHADDGLVVTECNPSESIYAEKENLSIIEEHFKLRFDVEKNFFKGHDFFNAKTLPILYKEVNLQHTFEVIKKFNPDMMFVFGSSIVKEPLLSLLKPGRFVNLHLGLSPYYRGSGTNFWPFVNEELEYVGSTILHIDAGIDTGDIIAHVRPVIEEGDNVHSIGCKVIMSSVITLKKVMDVIKEGKDLKRVRQWIVDNGRYYKKIDFNENSLLTYKQNMEKGLIKKYIQNPTVDIKLVNLE